jgi:uncharacterized protein (UPF0332 family)
MNDKANLITFRLTRADEAFHLSQLAIEKRYWNSSASELYYSCFYTILALFAKENIHSSTHSGVKTILSSNFIKTNILDARWGKLFSVLFNKRQEGDYGDFIILTEEEILPLVKEVEEFRLVLKKLIEQ